jgi:norsolorinic acid ketoreductase
VSTASPTELHRHWLVNTLGPIVLFQSFLPVLAQSHLVPVFACITTGAAQLSTMENLRLPNVAYGSSKVAANYVMKKIHLENEDMIAFPRESGLLYSNRELCFSHTSTVAFCISARPVAPGWVQTDLGNEGARNAGMSSAPLTVEQSVHGMLTQLDGATRETHGGKPINYDGKVLPW